MRLASRLRGSRLASVMGLVGAALLLSPPPAVADRDDWEDRGHYRRHDRGHHDRHDGHGRHYRRDHGKHGGKHHRHGDWCEPRRARYAYQPVPTWYGPPPRAYRARYYCEPCSHWYHDEPAFHRHVHHHHHVPQAVIPLVIMATVFGAVFGGYY